MQVQGSRASGLELATPVRITAVYSLCTPCLMLKKSPLYRVVVSDDEFVVSFLALEILELAKTNL